MTPNDLQPKLYFRDENGNIKWLFEDVMKGRAVYTQRTGLVASELADGQAAVTEAGKTHSSDPVKAQKLACQLIFRFLFLQRTKIGSICFRIISLVPMSSLGSSSLASRLPQAPFSTHVTTI